MKWDDRHSILLFLDFDGVLHPASAMEDNFFCCLPLLESFLREHPMMGVVISSSWRHHYPLDELVAYFSDDIRPRIVGATRDVRESNAPNRHKEIEDYLVMSNERRPYIVLDDSRFEFPKGFKYVHFCNANTGLTDADVVKLTRRVEDILGSTLLFGAV